MYELKEFVHKWHALRVRTYAPILIERERTNVIQNSLQPTEDSEDAHGSCVFRAIVITGSAAS